MTQGVLARRPRPSPAEPARAASGELERLFRREGPRLLRYFRGGLGDGEEARDLVQESFLRLARGWRAGALAKPEAYLQRIACHLLQDRRRGRRRQPAFTHLDQLELADGAPSAEVRLHARQQLQALEAALAELPQTTRTIFLAHRLEGRSYAAIAAGRGVSVSAVEKHMMRAIAHLDRRFPHV